MFVFICRAHNTVNRRLDKPIIKTLEQCIETIKNNTITTTSKEFRTKYIDYITKSWIRDRNDTTIIQLPRCSALSKINTNFWNKLSQEVKFEYLPNIDVTENIGKELPPKFNHSYLSSNLSFLKKNKESISVHVQPQPVSYFVTQQPKTEAPVIERKPSGFRYQNGKLKLIGT